MTRPRTQCLPIGELSAGAWDAFVQSLPHGLIYYSEAWLRVCEDLAGPTSLVVAFRDGTLVGGMPLVVSRSSIGTIVNSSAVVGAHGGPLARGDDAEVVSELWNTFFTETRRLGALSVTAITNPLRPHPLPLDSGHVVHQSERIATLLRLDDKASSEDLLAAMHPKTRNLVRKSLKAGFSVVEGAADEAFDHLEKLHARNAAQLGLQVKPSGFFSALRRHFGEPTKLRLTLAMRDERVAAALLVLYYNDVAEYFVPAINEADRSDQPLSALIFESLQDAVGRGCRWWNWGGSPPGNESLLRFKTRWGSRQFPYHYETIISDEAGALLSCTPEEILPAFPYAFALPFDLIKSRQDGTSSK